MIINLRKLDYLLIIIITILYTITAILESQVGQTFMRFLSPVLILIFVIVYLQTIRSLEAEFKRVKQASKKEILKNISEVEYKLNESISIDSEDYKEIKYLQHIVSNLEQNLINEIRDKTDLLDRMRRSEENVIRKIMDHTTMDESLKIVEERVIREIRDNPQVKTAIKIAEESVIKEIKDTTEFQQMIKCAEARIIKDLGNKTEQVYYQLDGLISINKILQDVRYPIPPFRGWAVSPDFTRILMQYIFDKQPDIIVELGSGVSTIISGYCLKMNGKGKIISLEHEEKYYDESLGFIKAHGLQDFVELHYAPLKQYVLNDNKFLWYDLTNVPITELIDIVTVDGPPGTIQKECRFPAYPLLLPHLNHKAIILVDDYIREDEQEMVKKWLTDPNLEQVDIFNTEKRTCVLRYNSQTH